jgi:hypothetical protein
MDIAVVLFVCTGVITVCIAVEQKAKQKKRSICSHPVIECEAVDRWSISRVRVCAVCGLRGDRCSDYVKYTHISLYTESGIAAREKERARKEAIEREKARIKSNLVNGGDSLVQLIDRIDDLLVKIGD